MARTSKWTCRRAHRGERAPAGNARPRRDHRVAAAVLPAEVGGRGRRLARSGQHRLSHAGSAGRVPLSGTDLSRQSEGRRDRLAAGVSIGAAFRNRSTWRSSRYRATPSSAWWTTAPCAACAGWSSSRPASPRSAPKAELATAAARQGARLRHADDRPQLHGPAQHRPDGAAQRLVLAGVSAGRPGGDVVAERRAGAGHPARRSGSIWGCPRSSVSATRRTSPATTCCNTGKRTRTPT